MSSQLLKKSLQIVEDKPLKKKQNKNIKAKKQRTNQNKSIEDNLKKLMNLSNVPTSNSKEKRPDFDKMFHNARQGTRAKKLDLEEKSAKEAEGKSIFTKEDFLKFERELFCDK